MLTDKSFVYKYGLVYLTSGPNNDNKVDVLSCILFHQLE